MNYYSCTHTLNELVSDVHVWIIGSRWEGEKNFKFLICYKCGSGWPQAHCAVRITKTYGLWRPVLEYAGTQKFVVQFMNFRVIFRKHRHLQCGDRWELSVRRYISANFNVTVRDRDTSKELDKAKTNGAECSKAVRLFLSVYAIRL